MSYSAAEIETIVRRVLSSLSAEGTAALTVGPAVAIATPKAAPVTSASSLQLNDSVITAQLLKGRLNGITELLVSKNAVVTPAARDLCRETKTSIVRGSSAQAKETAIALPSSSLSSSADSAPAAEAVTTKRPQRLVIAGTAAWHNNLSNQVCPKQASLQSKANDDASALQQIAAGIRNGHQAGVLIATAPHASCWQAAQQSALRPAVLNSWSELKNVLTEMPANLLIVSANSWNIASTANVVRHFFEHLKKQS